MRYLVTGGSGFLGKYIVDYLQNAGEEVIIATRNPQAPNHIKADFEKNVFEFPTQNGYGFDFIIHAAGKAHVLPKTNDDIKAFHTINVMGTKLLLEKIEHAASQLKGIVFISSVSIYGRETGKNISENEPLAATDPYGKSKIDAEKILEEWGNKNGIPIGIARLPLVAGQNAPGNLRSMIKGIKTGRYFRIGNGAARKSMVWAGDIAEIIPGLARKGGIYNFTDGYHPSFAELENAITKALNLPDVKMIPMPLAKMAALAGTIIEKITGKKMPLSNRVIKKIILPLTFSDQKARSELNWKPTPVLNHIKEIV
jgi:GlcNAc-P-P-Und epimerase